MRVAADIALFGLSAIYGAVVRTRNALYDAHLLHACEVGVPVVSIGNISAGGNAKTPLCLYLAEELKRRGFRPVILSRGYRGRLRGPHAVTLDDTVEEVGDEAVLMMRRAVAPVVVSRRRAAGARLIVAQGLGDVIILDDGLQHRRLARQVNIVSVDISTPEIVDAFVDGALLPFGRLREPHAAALRRTDMVIFAMRRFVSAPPELDPRLFRLLPQGLQLYRAVLQPEGVSALADGAPLAPQRVAAFCAIAKPEGFFDTLRELGFEVAMHRSYRDHHLFSKQDLHALHAAAAGLPLICTEKDAVKINPAGAEGIYMLKASMRVNPADAFLVQLTKRLLAYKQKACALGGRDEREATAGGQG